MNQAPSVSPQSGDKPRSKLYAGGLLSLVFVGSVIYVANTWEPESEQQKAAPEAAGNVPSAEH
jgi:hypothetical protein